VISEREAQALLRPRTGNIAASPIRPPIADWWTDHEQLAELWAWLEEQGREPTDPAYYLSKPWKWTPEYDEMRKAQTVPL
jgi:hypothetical protein